MTFSPQINNAPGLASQKMILVILLAEFLVFIISGVSFSFLHGAVFIHYGVDIFFGLLYFASIPQFIVSHQWLAVAADVSIVSQLLLLIRNPLRNRLAVWLMLLLFLYYVTLMGYLNHRNFHTGFVLVLFPFLFAAAKSRYFAYEATRYFLLFFYASAAFFKLWYGAFNHADHLSISVADQFAPYIVESNIGIRTAFNEYLVNTPGVGFVFLLLSFVAELVAVAGFFTKRFDKLIGISLLAFHVANWFVMDLAPFGQIAFISLLFVQKAFVDKQD